MNNNKQNSSTVQTLYNKLSRIGGVDGASNDQLMFDSNFAVAFVFDPTLSGFVPTKSDGIIAYNNGENRFSIGDAVHTFQEPEGDITPYVQSINIPNVSAPVENTKVENMFGGKHYATLGDVIPASFTFNVDFLSTERMIIENVIMPWMDQLKSNVWSFETVPYESATVSVFVFNQEGNRIVTTYHLHGVIPTMADTLDLSHAPTKQFTRTVTFTFDYMQIEAGYVEDINSFDSSTTQSSSGDRIIEETGISALGDNPFGADIGSSLF
jgi:hypothetical protein